MSAAKSPKALYLLVVAAFAAALVVTGCGGSGGQVVSGQSPPKNPPSAAVEPKREAGEEEAGEEGAAEEAISEAENGESGESEQTEEGESESGGGAESEGGEPGGAASAEGMTVFTTNCGSCHTLAAAGTSGVIGPNLDELMPSESTVEQQVINGGAPMPAFGKEEILAPNEIEAVAAYVSSEAGK